MFINPILSLELTKAFKGKEIELIQHIDYGKQIDITFTDGTLMKVILKYDNIQHEYKIEIS